MAMFVIYFINMQSLTQTNAFFTPVLRTHLQDTNALVCLNPESCRCDASSAEQPERSNICHIVHSSSSTLHCIKIINFISGATRCHTMCHSLLIYSLFIHNRVYILPFFIGIEWEKSLWPALGAAYSAAAHEYVMIQVKSRQGQTTSE